MNISFGSLVHGLLRQVIGNAKAALRSSLTPTQTSPPQSWRGSRKPFFVLGTLGLLAGVNVRAIQTSDYAVQVTATAQASPPRITLAWPQDSSGAPSSYVVSRKLRDAAFWGPGVSLPGTTTTYTDENVSLGGAYEYQVKKLAAGYAGFGYVYAGIEVPAVESRGKVVLIVENTYAADLAPELSQLEDDLLGDGWIVLRHDVARTDSVADVKALIRADYAADPANVKSVFLFGRVPVPYSGNRAPDGHQPDHLGAWPADVFYAEMNANWMDTYVNVSGANSSRNYNIPNDGKYDQSQVPSPIKLQIGRVDLSDLPAFNLSEKELLRQYLNKDHNFRHKLLNVDRRGLVVDAFGTFNGEAFASSGWRNFAPLLGADNVTSA
ncbi:MAG: hypothetical protein L0Z50_05960, partial [Verrucomicrobiales bacterium]|nr:hypothetical protein [Verrucomicrobiales bacterium]